MKQRSSRDSLGPGNGITSVVIEQRCCNNHVDSHGEKAAPRGVLGRPDTLRYPGSLLASTTSTPLSGSLRFAPAPGGACTRCDASFSRRQNIANLTGRGMPYPRWMRPIASARVASLLRNCPLTADVTVWLPGFRIPRMLMQRCSASMTTSTPLGSRASPIASAI
jgi:hypothetical protein